MYSSCTVARVTNTTSGRRKSAVLTGKCSRTSASSHLCSGRRIALDESPGYSVYSIQLYATSLVLSHRKSLTGKWWATGAVGSRPPRARDARGWMLDRTMTRWRAHATPPRARAHAPGPGLDQRVAGAACRCPGAAGYHRAGWLGRWAEGAELGPLRSAGWVDGRRVGGLEGRWVWCPQLFVCPRGRLDCPRGPAAEAA